MKKTFLIIFYMISMLSMAQEIMTPEKLWELGRVSALGI